MPLRSYVLTRAILTIPMIILLLTIVFLILRVMPGDPVTAFESKNIPEAVLAARRRELGLDQPIHMQYLNYMATILQGNLGLTALDRYPMSSLVLQRMPATIELAISSITIAIILGVLLGAHSAYRRNSPLDKMSKLYAIIIFSVPVFFLGLILQVVFGGLLPTSGRVDVRYAFDKTTGFVLIDTLLAGDVDALASALAHLVLPSLTLGLYLSGVFVRISRSHMIETLRQDYVVAARARGLLESRVLYQYGLRNAFIPIVTLMGLQFAALLGGAVLTETTFNWPGLGTLLVDGILQRDYTIVQGSVIIFAFVVAAISLLVDIIYAYLDPRVRF